MDVKRFAAAALSAVLLCACTGSDPADDGRGRYDGKEGETNATPTEAPQATPTEIPEEPPEEVPGYVEGNGGRFVKLTDGVYFLKYEAAAFPEPALNGALFDYSEAASGISTLCRYDENSGTMTELGKTDCNGELFWLGNCFFCNGLEGVYLISSAGLSELYSPGRVLGTSVDASWLAIEGNDGLSRYYSVLDCDGFEDYRLDLSEYNAPQFCGLDMSTLIFLDVDENGTTALYSADSKGVTDLGTATIRGGYGNPRCEKMERNEVAVYLMLADYTGETWAFDSFQAVSVVPGKEDSLVIEQDGYDPEVCFCTPTVLPDMRYDPEEDRLFFYQDAENEVDLSHDIFGDLVLHGWDMDRSVLCPAFLPYQDRMDLRLQAAEKLGDAVYLMVAGIKYEPSFDYSWMRYYSFDGNMYYLRVPVAEKAEAVEISGECDWSAATTFDAAAYADLVGSWRMDEVSAEGSTDRESAPRDFWMNFSTSAECGIMDELDMGGLYYLSCSETNGAFTVSGENELSGNLFTAQIVNGQLQVTFLSVPSGDGDAMSWSGYFQKATEAEIRAEFGEP
ncbi:MAG: hypothetical protein K6E50_10225 [Lachnospiraceae bacterium]|nr:hypothetical protein [Lachnospiraceae bacterium]